MLKLGPDSLKLGSTHAFTHILTTPPLFLTTTDQRPCRLVASPWPPLLLILVRGTYSGIPCHSIMTMMCQLLIPPDPSHSPIGAISVNKSTPLTPSGTALHAKTVITAKDATTPVITAPTPTPSALPSPSVWYHSLTIMPCPGRCAGVRQPPSMLGTTQMIEDTTVRIIPMTTMTGRLDVWKHQSSGGVMS